MILIDTYGLFYVAKVLSLSQQAGDNDFANVLWYRPKMPRRIQDGEGNVHNLYANYIQCAWEPSRDPHGWNSHRTFLI